LWRITIRATWYDSIHKAVARPRMALAPFVVARLVEMRFALLRILRDAVFFFLCGQFYSMLALSESTQRTCRDRDEARQYPLHRGGGSCPTGSIANTGIRIAAARSGKNRLGTGRLKRRRLARAHCRCRARIRFRVARNAAPC